MGSTVKKLIAMFVICGFIAATSIGCGADSGKKDDKKPGAAPPAGEKKDDGKKAS
jgi:hypothetical protein